MFGRLRQFLSRIPSAVEAPRELRTSPRHVGFLPDLGVDPLRPIRPATPDAPGGGRPEVDAAPTLSYVIGSYNRRRLLEQAIESVRADAGGLSCEIFVIDGGSTDGSAEWLAAQKDVVTIVQHNRYEVDGAKRRRMSWGRFMNLGFRAARGEYVVMISDDCYLLPGATRAAVDRIAEARAAGVRVGACAYYFRNYPQEGEYYVQRTLGGNLMVNHGIYVREALASVGFANEDEYVFYKADSDLSLSLWAAGWAIVDSPRSVCEHYLSPEEAARVSNNAVMDFDRTRLWARWPDLVQPDSTRKMGKVLLDWTDPNGTAERVFGGAPETAGRGAAPPTASARRRSRQPL